MTIVVFLLNSQPCAFASEWETGFVDCVINKLGMLTIGEIIGENCDIFLSSKQQIFVS